MPHEVKSTHALHSHYKYKHLSWGKYDEEKKRPDLRLDNVFGSYQAGVSPEGGIAPFGQLPLLEITDDSSPKPILLCQSVAIMRYLAVEFGLAPESNLEKALADMVVDAVMQIRAKIRKCRFTTDATLKEKLLKEFQGALPNDLKNLEKILQGNSGGK
ncbi:unnamed protein product [Porites lobata]|uniref:GST N-terminal domain-containing protein n=1 Tax=Porites lobata TaxID=104759 RepID=A0ABN8NH65_9CNID|nr:unnamed protein product [Porites lobata]